LGAQHGELLTDAHVELDRCRLRARAADQLLEVVTRVVLAQARLAVREVLADPVALGLTDLGVEELEELGDRLRAVDVVVLAHRSPPSAWAGTRPRSRAYSVSSSRSWPRPRCRRDITVPIGVPMISAISL